MKRLAGLALGCWMAAATAHAAAGESARMARAKDFIADERWSSAITELQAAAGDPKEPNRAEALFWLAHCQNQNQEPVAALETISRLERDFPSSPWVRFAQSLHIEIAQKLNRDDVLWRIARVPQPSVPAAAPAPPALPTPPRPPLPTTIAPAAPPRTPAIPPTTIVAPIPPDPAGWVLFPETADMDLRIQALGSLIQDHPDRVIPMLTEIALDPSTPGDGRRAVFVLAQSARPEARTSVLEVAKRAPEAVRIAAVRELGRFPGPAISSELLQVYRIGSPRVRREVVTSLGDRDDRPALLRIAQSEADPTIRNTAIVTLGRAGGRDEVRLLYKRLPKDGRLACLNALVAARDDEELIRIADSDADPAIRQQARSHLRVLGTPKAMAYLASHK